jgi:uncharacterized protein
MGRLYFDVRSGLTLRRSRIHGRGVFARVHIPEGTRIIEYRGERISNDEADARYPDDPTRQHHTFLFSIDDELVVDAAFKGNMSRWINHSCDPNCDAVIEGGRIWIESIRDIAPGEELRDDYTVILPERHTPPLKNRLPGACRSGRMKL